MTLHLSSDRFFLFTLHILSSVLPHSFSTFIQLGCPFFFYVLLLLPAAVPTLRVRLGCIWETRSSRSKGFHFFHVSVPLCSHHHRRHPLSSACLHYFSFSFGTLHSPSLRLFSYFSPFSTSRVRAFVFCCLHFSRPWRGKPSVLPREARIFSWNLYLKKKTTTHNTSTNCTATQYQLRMLRMVFKTSARYKFISICCVFSLKFASTMMLFIFKPFSIYQFEIV